MKASFQSTENETVDFTDYYFPDGVWCSVMNKSGGCVTGPSIESLPSRIYQSYTHIKDGNIVPLATYLIGREKNVTKVDSLLKNPLELHIHTQMNEDFECIATGNFLSDDGKTLNTTNRQNIYQFDFSATTQCGVNEKNDNGSIVLNVTQLAKATELDVLNATAMDFLGKVVIYNTKDGDLVMQGKYDVTVNYLNSTSVKLAKQAEFNPAYNMTIYEGWNYDTDQGNKHEIPLFEIGSLEFAAAA